MGRHWRAHDTPYTPIGWFRYSDPSAKQRFYPPIGLPSRLGAQWRPHCQKWPPGREFEKSEFVSYAIRMAMELIIPLRNVSSMEIRKRRNREVGGAAEITWYLLENLSAGRSKYMSKDVLTTPASHGRLKHRLLSPPMKYIMNSLAGSFQFSRYPNERTKSTSLYFQLMALIAGLVLAAGPAQAGNLLVNPGFEAESGHA